MAATLNLSVEERTAHGTRACRALREKGLVPAVLYGGGAEKVSMLSVPAREFEKVWRAAGESTVVALTGLGTERSVLIHDVAVDPVRGTPTHVDLYAVRTDHTVEVDVPLAYVGVAPAEKELGGTLIKVMHALTIEALPKDLPHEIEVDISLLATFDDQILVRDVALPSGVTAVEEGTEVVALVQAARAEEEAPAAADISAVEVEKKGKEEPAA